MNQLALNFLVHLRNLCLEEISKREQYHNGAETEEVVSVPCNNKISGHTKPSQDDDLPVKSDTPDFVPSFENPKKNVYRIPIKVESSVKSHAQTYRCSKCDYSTDCHSNFINHDVMCIKPRFVKCFLCLEKCNAADLDDHIKSTHLSPDFFVEGDDGSYNCIKCNYKSTYFSQFKKHLLTNTHRGLKVCKICNLTLTSSELDLHRKKVHGQVGYSFICKICYQLFASKGNLDRHKSSAHRKNEGFKCTECDLSFPRQDNLKRHLRTHSERRNHVCSICNHSFKSKDTLREHIGNIHSRNRYQCPECFRGFADESDRDNHALTHQGFLFRCMMCGKGFRTHYKREAHFQAHLNAARNPKTAQLCVQNNHSIKLKKSESNVPFEGKHTSSTICGRKGGDIKCDAVTSDSQKNLKGMQSVTSASRKRKASVEGNSKKKYLKSDELKSLQCEIAVSKVSLESVKKCGNSNNFGDDSDSETYQPSDETASGRKISNSLKLVDTLPKEDSRGFVLVDNAEIHTINRESEDYWSYPHDVCNSEQEIIGSPGFLPIPESTIFVDLNNVVGVESFSLLQPDSSVLESTLVIDVDNLSNIKNVDVINGNSADAYHYPMEIEYYEVQSESLDAGNLSNPIAPQSDNVASICSIENVVSLHTKAEGESGVSLCNKASQDNLKKVPTNSKKTSVRQKSRTSSKTSQYPQTDKKVVMKNLCTDDDVFALPEFVIEEDE